MDFSKLDPKKFITIKGARVHNLKNIDVAIPRNKLVVITGLSGSGKSSLAMDTLYADGQRRYVESLSSYARQFLGRMSKPEVDYIKGVSPAIAIEQKVNTRNPRSTVGTSTEIYEYIKLLYARIGKTYSPVSGNLVKRHSVSDVTDHILSRSPGSRVMVFAPLQMLKDRSLAEQLMVLNQQGYSRIALNGDIERIDEALQNIDRYINSRQIRVVIDRLKITADDQDLEARIADSVQTAFFEGHGECIVEVEHDGKKKTTHFSNRFELDGMVFEEPSVNLFSFNNPFGACKTCEGFGSIIGIDQDLVIPNKSLSVYEDAVACWKGEKMSEWKEELVLNAYKFDFPIHKPYYQLSEEQKALLWSGNEYFGGIRAFFKHVEEQTYKIQYRVMLSRYRGKTICPECQGTRLRQDAAYVKVNGKSINQLVLMSIKELLAFFKKIRIGKHDMEIAGRLILEITSRLNFLNDVGLSYLNLNRLSSTLSGGESQRINLATSLGSSLVGSMYILDEPSIGLHPRDTYLLIDILKRLRDIGNTVIVVEHDKDIIESADFVVDMGPKAGSHGGEVVFQGNLKGLLRNKKSLTAAYLRKEKEIDVPASRRHWKDFISVEGAHEHNLKYLDIQFPLNVFTVITGVSGSGKSTLVKDVLYPALKKAHGGFSGRAGKLNKLSGDINRIGSVEMIDQNPIGRSSRSNPATYLKAFDEIRGLFAQEQLARMRGYKPGYFSFNIPGGRCEECEGEGVVKIEMQFMADIYLQCEACGGRRFKNEVLDVKVNGLDISQVLDLTINQAIDFFGSTEKPGTLHKKVISKLQPLKDVGLGYLKLGQASSTLSGGEAQRIKLAFFLSKGEHEAPTMFIFDEPTTGLHFHDIKNLVKALNALIEKGHTVIVIEHNLEVIKSADWIIDLGPEGGDDGGRLVFNGAPEDLVEEKNSYTAKYLSLD
jgi:excinuclease ABC subunit A